MHRHGEPTLDSGWPGLEAGGATRPGPPIAGRYQLGRELAAGSTGTLHHARDLEQGAEVAVKLLPPAVAVDDAALRRLRDELAVTRVAARSRASIAAVLDVGRAADGRTFLVLEPLDGESLAALLAGAAVPLDRALRIALQVADGLETAHNHGLAHGAVAAEHVLVDARGHVKLVGFEVARVPAPGGGDRDATDRPTGDREWADVRGTAALLRAMLAALGQPGAAERRGAARGPGEPARAVPRALRRVSAAALEAGGRRRSTDMGALVNALWEALDVLPARERPRRGPRESGLTWILAGAGVLALAVLGGATVLAPGSRQRAVPTTPGRLAVTRPMPSAAPPGPTTSVTAPASPPAEQRPAAPAPAVDAAAPPHPRVPPAPRAPAARPPAGRVAEDSAETAGPARVPIVRVPPPPRPPDPTSSGRESSTPGPATRAPGPVAAPRAAPGQGAPGPMGAAAHADADGPDPAAVIDWLLQESSGSR